MVIETDEAALTDERRYGLVLARFHEISRELGTIDNRLRQIVIESMSESSAAQRETLVPATMAAPKRTKHSLWGIRGLANAISTDAMSIDGLI